MYLKKYMSKTVKNKRFVNVWLNLNNSAGNVISVIVVMKFQKFFWFENGSYTNEPLWTFDLVAVSVDMVQ
jgi:hypothetical protein